MIHFLAILLFSLTGARAGDLETVCSRIVIPEPRGHAVQPETLRPVDEEKFNRDIMPELVNLRFYSHQARAWKQVPHDKISNQCFARRAVVDAYLWFGQPLKAELEIQGGEKRYLLPGFKNRDFKKKAWVETARINVVGRLKTADGVKWNNHEAVIVNTDQGVRVVDPSFSDQLLTLERWFSFFAPKGLCQFTDMDGLGPISTQLAMVQQFKQTWNPEVPECGYVISQRLDARDAKAGTGGFFGTTEERFLSAKFWKYLERDLLK